MIATAEPDTEVDVAELSDVVDPKLSQPAQVARIEYPVALASERGIRGLRQPHGLEVIGDGTAAARVGQVVPSDSTGVVSLDGLGRRQSDGNAQLEREGEGGTA